MTEHVFVIEDDVKVARLIETKLSLEGYQVSIVHDGLSGMTAVREHQPDLLIVDWTLPDCLGVEICRRLRATGNLIPIIMLTAKDKVADRVSGLNAGADDSVAKPFNWEELLARIRANLRRTQPQVSEVLQFLNLRINLPTRRVFRGSRQLELTTKEYDVLKYLLQHPHQVVTRDQLLQRVWGYDFVGNSNTVEVYIRYLRLKLEEHQEKRLIHTIRSVGYVLRENP